MSADGWQFWIDRGGTFTDVIGRSPNGSTVARKLLSQDSRHYADAAVEGIVRILSDQKDSLTVDSIRMGTTVATNALLEGNGEPTVLVTTRGFADALSIAYQNRPDIFALDIRLPNQLHARVIEVDERVDADGQILEAVDTEKLRAALQDAYDAGIRSAAICFMHAYRFDGHEKRAGEIAKAVGLEQISMSHEVSPLQKLISRGDTTVADAYLSPILKRYVQQFESELASAGIKAHRVLFMQSNGGLVEAGRFRGKDSILSGPAGGVVGMVDRAAAAGLDRLIGFDMGGTSTDVSLYPGDYEFVDYTEIAGIRLRSPMMRVHTIAAGGSSILNFESGRFQVGPGSAGAEPGPASYRQDGPLTLTDANLMLGRILLEHFPKVFGPHADQALDAETVRSQFEALAETIAKRTDERLSPEGVAAGFIRIAVENMANAIKKISIQRGFDPAEFTLCCFGGAGGQHACQVADRLGIDKILIDPLAGVLSAYGIGIAPIRSYRQQAVGRHFDAGTIADLYATVCDLESTCVDGLLEQGLDAASIHTRVTAQIKVSGTDTPIPVGWAEHPAMVGEFDELHQRRFGFPPGSVDLVIESLRVDATGETAGATQTDRAEPAASAVAQITTAEVYMAGKWESAPVFQREALPAGFTHDGPAVLVEATGTIVIEAGWRIEVNPLSQVLMTRVQPLAATEHIGNAANPIMLEVFSQHFMHIAEQMGAVLESTAHSVNIKERLDFSCALFDEQGQLIANAPHIPVHLGSMDDSVQSLLAAERDGLLDGDVFASNAPYHGGTHLPDITVISPIIDQETKALLFLVASRAHHADVGGISPGSMPPDSTHIDQEGVLLDNVPLTAAGQFREAELRGIFTGGRYPARNPNQNLADLKAQIAANQRGSQLLLEMAGHFGLDAVRAYMKHVRDNAEESVRAAIETLHDGEFEVQMDGGECIRVAISVDRRRREATIDFSGTSSQTSDNFNAPAAICRAAALYVFRTLVAADIPLNAGCSKPLKIVIPPGSLLNPGYPAAVVAGNVETSQCVADAMFGALGILAGSQGTMNNLTFGTGDYQYYETISGGSGAGRTFDGTDAVQTHMTNSRLTDPEVLEARFPVLVREFSIRRGSGGAGHHHGGDGVVRKLEFREAMQAAILSNNRRIAPFGLNGGEPGTPGHNYLIRSDGSRQELQATDHADVGVGDLLVISTPGGGGYGSPAEST